VPIDSLMQRDVALTTLLECARAGDAAAANELYQRLYGDLRRLARAQLSRTHRRGPTLNTTALVHEAYLRLVPAEGLAVESTNHFLNLAAKVMRGLIVDSLRRRDARKRGADVRVEWPEGFEPGMEQPLCAEEVLALDEALQSLERESPRLAHLVELRFFGGLNLAQIASLLGVGERTLKSDWRRARAFLWSELRGAGTG
jgi:RNA polymerase sigma factor (TIGR02999 family)